MLCVPRLALGTVQLALPSVSSLPTFRTQSRARPCQCSSARALPSGSPPSGWGGNAGWGLDASRARSRVTQVWPVRAVERGDGERGPCHSGGSMCPWTRLAFRQVHVPERQSLITQREVSYTCLRGSGETDKGEAQLCSFLLSFFKDKAFGALTPSLLALQES